MEMKSINWSDILSAFATIAVFLAALYAKLINTRVEELRTSNMELREKIDTKTDRTFCQAYSSKLENKLDDIRTQLELYGQRQVEIKTTIELLVKQNGKVQSKKQ